MINQSRRLVEIRRVGQASVCQLQGLQAQAVGRGQRALGQTRKSGVKTRFLTTIVFTWAVRSSLKG